MGALTTLRFLFRPAWHRALCLRYGVTPRQALELGTRSPGRRPTLPAGNGCPAVSGLTLEDIWALRPRDTAAAVAEFYQDMGTWAVFRQAVRNRRRSWGFVDRRLPWTRGRVRLLEFGCGIAPCAAWLLERRADQRADFVLMDVPSEHFRFGLWRLDQRRRALTARITMTPLFSRAPLQPFDAVVATEVLEHLPDPLGTVAWFAGCLVPGGSLHEDFHPHQPGDAQAAWDLPSAQAQRPAVYDFLQEQFTWVAGQHWGARDGGGTRTWRKR